MLSGDDLKGGFQLFCFFKLPVPCSHQRVKTLEKIPGRKETRVVSVILRSPYGGTLSVLWTFLVSICFEEIFDVQGCLHLVIVERKCRWDIALFTT